MNTDTIRDGLAQHLEATPPPPGDLTAVRRRGRRIRRRRAGGAVIVAAVAAVAGSVAMSLDLTDLPSSTDPGGERPGATYFGGTGTADLSHGLRAYAAPGAELHLAGREFPGEALDALDTDAVATPYGVVYNDGQGRPTLFAPDGRQVLLDGAPTVPGFRSTIKGDATAPVIAYASLDDGVATVKVYDLQAREIVARAEAPCVSGCDRLVVEAVDSGAVFLRLPDGVHLWRYAEDDWSRVAGRETRIADVRNGVVLYDGAPPTALPPGWRGFPGAIDSLLAYDGGHVLGWSSTLEPTSAGGEPIVLERGPADGGGLAWWAFDTDGSVLVAVAVVKDGMAFGDNVVYDCEVPSGRCAKLGPLTTRHGDPMFIGVDM